MPNIVVLRGTSGSGKTYVAYRVIERLVGEPTTLPLGPKGKVGGYRYQGVSLAGRYETGCGGCDSLSWKGAADDIEALVLGEVERGQHVLLEGLMVSTWGADRLLRMHAQAPLTVVHLTTPLDICLTAVNARRAERAAAAGKPPPEPVNPKNTSEKHRGLLVHTRNQRLKGVVVEDHDRAGALERVLELLS